MATLDQELEQSGTRSRPGATAPASEPAGAPNRFSGRPGPVRKLLFGALLLAAVAAAGLGVRGWLASRDHVTTDDAQVEGRIVPVLDRVGGYVAEVAVDDNQPVKAGDLLARIDERDLRAKLMQAEADLATAQAAVGSSGRAGQAEARLSAAKAQEAEARANAERTRLELTRDEALLRQDVISQQQFDDARTAATAAASQLDAATNMVSAAMADLRAASSRLASASASRDQAALQLAYARLTAPVDGVVSRKSAEVGQLVQPGQQLFVVVELSDVWVIGNFKETQMRDVRPGNAVEIRVDTYPGRVFAGVVESVSPATGARFSLLPPDNATGNFTKVVQRIPVRIRLVRGNDAREPLRPGMSARVTVQTKHA